MLRAVDQYYMKQEEPNRSCLMALRDHILSLNDLLTEDLKYGMPFICYKGKMFCYFWKDKKNNEPYIGIVEGNRLDHPMLEKGKRSRMKILRINPTEDLPLDLISEILTEAMTFY